VSPDEKYLAVESGTSFPLGFPALLFPRSLDIWSADGRPLASVGTSPLDDRSAISSVERLGPRQPMWSPDGSALWFLSWEDRVGADFAKAIADTTQPVPGTDRLFRFAAPFTGSMTLVAISEQPMVDMAWAADGKVLVVRDHYEPRRIERMWWIDPERPITRTMLYRRSAESGYGHPGTPLRRDGFQQKTLWTTHDGRAIYLAGDGFGPGGQRPFLDRMELATGRTTRLFESASEVLENVGALLDADGGRFVTMRQTARTPPN
jgi:dipeptidyl aminopeptidase/acylaminoacyl peptidase